MIAFFRQLYPFVRPYRGRLLLGTLCGVFYALSNAALMFAVKLVCDIVFPKPGSEPVAELLRRAPRFVQEHLPQWLPQLQIGGSKTGLAHGGSLIFYASLCKAMDHGRVIGIDIEIRAENRAAIECHSLGKNITLLEGSSTAPDIVARAKGLVQPGERVLVIFDSKHTKAHVRDELDAYHTLVTPGSYIVATDGIMQDLHDVPRGNPEWRDDNPAAAAALEFSEAHPEFVLEEPAWPFNESTLKGNITHWPGAYLRRLK